MQSKLGEMLAINPTGQQPYSHSVEASMLNYICNAYKLFKKNIIDIA